MRLLDSDLEKYSLNGVELFRYKNVQQLEFEQRIWYQFILLLHVVSEELEILGRKLNQEYRSIVSAPCSRFG